MPEPTPVRGKSGSDDALRMARLLVKMGANAGGRVDPARILRRPDGSHARRAFMEAQDAGWLDGSGYVTEGGRTMLRADA